MQVLVCDGCSRTREKEPAKKGVQNPAPRIGWWTSCSLQLGSDVLFSAKDLCSPCRATLIEELKKALTEYWKSVQKAGPTVRL